MTEPTELGYDRFGQALFLVVLGADSDELAREKTYRPVIRPTHPVVRHVPRRRADRSVGS